MIKIGLFILLTTSVFFIYSVPVFSEEDFYQSNDSSDDFIENDSDVYQNRDELNTVIQEPEEDEDIPINRQVPIYQSSDWKLPNQIPAPGEKVIIVDPKIHLWGAYSATGILMRQGLASAGAKWCKDLDRPCRTTSGIFRIQSLGAADCISTRYPLGEGGAPMPYCMYFNGNQGLHGSNQVAAANISHGCVRLRVEDAEWLRYHFARRGTKVIIKNY